MSDELRFRDEQHVRDAVERLTEYMRTYDQQHGYESYSAQTFIDDVLYGLGVAIEPKAHQFAQGFKVFKEKLADHLGLVRADLAAEREQQLVEAMNSLISEIQLSHKVGRPANIKFARLGRRAILATHEHNEGEL